MIENESQGIITDYHAFLNNKAFPCIGAKAALARKQVKCMVAGHMACPGDDIIILQFLYDFIDIYRLSAETFHSAAIIFKQPLLLNEELYDELLWKKLQSLADLDGSIYCHDKRVNTDPGSEKFSYSLKEEAFFIIGLHPASSRQSRQFTYPAITFNPHAQFEKLRETNSYQTMKDVVRKRDIAYSGSINPMLDDFGKSSEVFQYSGRNYDDQWQCPLHIKQATNENNPTP